MASEVTIRCKRTVNSTRAPQQGQLYHLSVLDRMMELHVLRIICYYQFSLDAGVFSVALAKLRESLAEMLSSFPVVSGRLQRTVERNWMIKCNYAGVRMIEARARGSVEEWLQTVDRAHELKLTHWEDMYVKPYFWSTFYVQVTEFENGGLAIGLSCSHMLADAATATMLIKDWADTYLLGKMLSPPYFHPLPPRRFSTQTKAVLREPCAHVINHYMLALENANAVSSLDSENCSTIAFAFSDDMVRQCMVEAGIGGVSPTAFEALAALIWVSISSVKGSKEEGLLNMSLCLEMRKVLGLSREFFGNAMVFSQVRGDGIEGGRMDRAAKAIGDVVEKMGYENVTDLVQWLENNNYSARPPSLYGPQLVCANWEGLGSYDAMFELGVRPVRVSYYLDPVIGEGQVLVLPGGDGSLSRVVMVTLPGDQVIRLSKEELILRFSPTILMKA